MGGEEDDGWALPAGMGGGRGVEDGEKGSGTTRTVGYATAMFGFFNEPLSSCSLATELLLLAGEVQHKHIKTPLLLQNPLLFVDRYTFV